MSPHLFLLFVAFTVVSCTATTTTTTPLTSSRSSIKSDTATTTTSPPSTIDAALISRQLVNLTRLDWHTNEYFIGFFEEDDVKKNRTKRETYSSTYKGRKGITAHGPAISKKHKNWIAGHYSAAVSLLDSAPTLFMMGLTEEYTKIRHWVATKLIINETKSAADLGDVDRLLANLIGLHGLTGDAVYLEKAQVIWSFLSPKKLMWDRIRTTLYLEYHYLSEVTGNTDWAQWAVNYNEKLIKNQFKEDFPYSTEYLLAKAKHAYLNPTLDRIDRLRHQIDTIFANPNDWWLKSINDTSLWYFDHDSKLLSIDDAGRIVAFALTGAAIMKYCGGTSC